mmetsp:Transcript_52842/g.67759  ORF Transcript_52842/g.67759 Transcript_52842/m.67759 type:complete len:229 (+) Transcript_52842:92-778(+)
MSTSQPEQRKNVAAPTNKKFMDPMEKMSDKISNHINEQHAATLIMFAWHYLKRKDTYIAQMIQVDRLGFELRCHLPKGKYVEERINFPCGPIDNGAKMVKYISTEMKSEASYVKFPSGPLCNIVLAVYFLIALVYFESHGGEDLSFLPNEWAKHMPNREHLHWGFLAVIGAHLLQAMACCWVLKSRLKVIQQEHLLGWFISCATLGYPVWSQVILLKKAYSHGRLKRL